MSDRTPYNKRSGRGHQPPGTRAKPNITPLTINTNMNINSARRPRTRSRDPREKDSVAVFCRIRPLPPGNELCVFKNDDETLELRTSSQRKNSQFYTFRHVFGQSATQSEVFQSIGLPLVKDLLLGKDGLLFTYGVTSSGKTYTLTGEPEDCGIVPRTLDVIFNSISAAKARKFVFKPDGANGFTVQATMDAMLEWQTTNGRNGGRTPGRTPSVHRNGGGLVTRRRDDELDRWESRHVEISSLAENICENHLCGVFITYVEIYNNYIYDLLDDSSLDVANPRTVQNQCKSVQEDSRNRVYVNKATEIEVESAEEAIELFLKGLRRRTIAHTTLNAQSSRSHSVFTIRIAQAPKDPDGTGVVQDTDLVTISQLSLVDLAGSERTKRTENAGSRLKEAGNINNSLMALRMCLEGLRENQRTGGSKRRVPYRDSKITHLFRSYFEGEGRVEMIISVNPALDNYDETIQVMKFAELSQDVMVQRAAEMPQYNFARTIPAAAAAAVPSAPDVEWNAFSIGPNFPGRMFSESDDQLCDEWVECVKERANARKQKSDHLKRLQITLRDQLVSQDTETAFLNSKLSQLRMDMEARENQHRDIESRHSRTEKINADLNHKVSDLERRCRAMENTAKNQREQLAMTHEEREHLTDQMRREMNHQKKQITLHYRAKLKEHMDKLEQEKHLSHERAALIYQILSTGCIDSLTRDSWLPPYQGGHNFSGLQGLNTNAGSSSALPTTGPDSTPTSGPTGPRLRSRRDLHTHSQMSPMSCPRSTVGRNTTDELASPTRSTSNPPVANPRHRRSLSAGTEKWIDHRPPGTLELGTVFKPRIRNSISVTKLKSKDIMNKDAAKYSLMHHEAQDDGEVSTQIFKGDVIPSVSGGAQVIFNDVETLRQTSPPGRKRTVSESNPQLTSSPVVNRLSATRLAAWQNEQQHPEKRGRF